MLWIFLQTQINKLNELFTEILSGQGRDFTIKNGLCHIDAIGALIVRISPSGAFKENQSEGPDVTLVAVWLIPNSLW
jgi:hypothetical protein